MGWIKLILMFLMAIIYIGAGYMHMVKPEIYRPMMPTWIPYPE
jgi:uncharacterized membrane protein